MASCRHGYRDEQCPYCTTIDSLRTELAAEQEKVSIVEEANQYLRGVLISNCMKQNATLTLDNQRLREALIVLSNYAPNEVWDEYQYLSTPTDTSALDAYVAEKVEPWKKAVQDCKDSAGNPERIYQITKAALAAQEKNK